MKNPLPASKTSVQVGEDPPVDQDINQYAYNILMGRPVAAEGDVYMTPDGTMYVFVDSRWVRIAETK